MHGNSKCKNVNAYRGVYAPDRKLDSFAGGHIEANYARFSVLQLRRAEPSVIAIVSLSGFVNFPSARAMRLTASSFWTAFNVAYLLLIVIPLSK